MKGLIQDESGALAFSNTPILQCSTTTNQLTTFTGKAIENYDPMKIALVREDFSPKGEVDDIDALNRGDSVVPTTPREEM